jgi:starch-binding outer membrane protein SusE/F
MKIFKNSYYFLLGFIALALMSCEKEEVRAVFKDGTPPVLSNVSTPIVLVKENAGQKALTLEWSESDFGFKAPIQYSIELVKKGTAFTEAIKINASNLTKREFIVAALNSEAIKMGLLPGSPNQVDVRVVADVGAGMPKAVSNVITISVTPYLDIPIYPSLFVPGGHQGWNPGEAPKVSSKNDNKVYEGYVNFPNATEFKFTSQPDWNGINYGNGGAGVLSTDGGAGNLSVSSAGYYRLIANTDQLTWTATQTSWGIIGSATANGWNSDQDMTYDAASKTWKATLVLTQGEIKFRANDGWDINFGDNGPDGILEYGGDNIAIAEAGTYQITLDLSIAAFYRYSVKKQ